MIEWSVFYQLLDLPRGQKPTYYQLLGIKPENCSRAALHEALEERRKLLRRRIPGPQFIPLVLKFEQEYLEPAVRVLGNPKLRKAYDKQLKQRQQPAIAQRTVTSERKQALRIGYILVTAACNKDGTLDEEKRPALAKKLQKLGFSTGDIRVLFNGIPTPGQKLSRSLASVMEEAEDLVGGQPPTVDLPEQLSERVIYWVVAIAVTIVIMAVLGIVLIILLKQPAGINPGKTPQPATARPVAPPLQQAPSAKNQPKKSPSPILRTGQPDSNLSTLVDLPVSQQVFLIHNTYNFSDQPADVLADVALTMLATCERISYITHDGGKWYEELGMLLQISDSRQRRGFLIRDVHLARQETVMPVLRSRDDRDYLQGLYDILHSDKPRYQKYQAIARLREYNTPAAANILINMLQGNDVPDSFMINRITRALRRMSDTKIPGKLLDILESPRKAVVQPIIITLLTLNNLQDEVPDTCPGVLPYKYNRSQLAACVQWWRSYYLANTTNQINTTVEPLPLKARDRLILSLTARVAYYTRAMADSLKGYSWDEQQGQLDLPDDESDLQVYDVNDQWLDALDDLFEQLLRLARTHPRAGRYADKLDAIELAQRSGLLLSDDFFRQVRVDLADSVSLLEILVTMEDTGGKYKDALKSLQQERDRRLANDSPPAAVREYAYSILALCDLWSQRSRVRQWNPKNLLNRSR